MKGRSLSKGALAQAPSVSGLSGFGRRAGPAYPRSHHHRRSLAVHDGRVSRWEGSVGGAYDNVMTESFFSTLETELLSRRRFASHAEARMACFSYIEGWYNSVRLHSGLGYRSPMAYEVGMEAALAKT